MNFEEWVAKPLLRKFGIPTLHGKIIESAEEARIHFQGPSVIKAQIPTGSRGKLGGIKFASDVNEAVQAAEKIIGMNISGHKVSRVLIEPQVLIEKELYAAVINDRKKRCPTVLFSSTGGINIENMAEDGSAHMYSCPVDILQGMTKLQAKSLVRNADLENAEEMVSEILLSLYSAYRSLDAELLEINPLAIIESGEVVALDCKFVLDDSAITRQPSLANVGGIEPETELEKEAASKGLQLIELGGQVGLLANGAGLTMSTMDAIVHFGGQAANFLEIGGNSYTKAESALEILLKLPSIKCLLINFCGAFARTDVMVKGVVEAWKKLNPNIPIFFSIHGTGDELAIALVRSELGVDPFEYMDDAVKAAIAATMDGQQ